MFARYVCKMKGIYLFFFFFSLCCVSDVWAQKTPYETGNGNQTATYQECINFYRTLSKEQPSVSLLTYGSTDCGEPLHLVVVTNGIAPIDSKKERQDFIKKIKREEKAVLMVMNGIHPGEPEGIDASMMLARDFVTKKSDLLDDVVLCIIPVYNIGGALNRNCCTRANQNGPEAYGFRGNGQNLDLNRDFVKGDSKNTWAFWEMFQEWKPDVFMDNHTSNGADYQYTMTLITSQRDKQDEGVKQYMKTMLPQLEKEMEKCGEEICPYVNVHGKAMDDAIVAFFESPRYSTGYTSLFGTVSFVAEAHMLKPFDDRVKATYRLMEGMMTTMVNTKDALLKRNSVTVQSSLRKKHWPIRWELDKETFDEIDFRGYEYDYRKGAIPGHDRLYYDRTKPYEKKVKYYNTYKLTDSIEKPFAYVIPQAWYKVIDRLKTNGCLLRRSISDTAFSMEYYRIEDITMATRPYEGHFLHSDIKVSKHSEMIHVRKGDYFLILPNRFAIETLEPTAHDPFMAWNFFDPILQQKEWYSAYVFDDIAADLLKKDKTLRKEFEAKREAEPEFAKNYQAQLYYIYQHSPHYEKAHMRYPVYRLMDVQKLPIK